MIHTEEKKTPLYEAHRKLNAKLVSFHGWLLPIQYTGIIEEHNATRTKAGLFDISHLGKLEITGRDSLKFLQRLLSNNVNAADHDKVVYSPMCNEEGGILDDVFVYNLSDERRILIVNAVTFDKDLNWINARKISGITIRDINDAFGGIAIQGPRSAQIMRDLCEIDLNTLKHRRFRETKVDGFDALLSRSGYTGEDGFEVFIAADKTEKLWNDILRIGKPYGLLPAGLGARDTLRLEAGCPLYGIDADESKTPLEAGLERFVDLSKDFIGKSAILNKKAQGIREILVGFKMTERAIPRTGYNIEKSGEKIGIVTSGTYSPTLKENIGFAYIATEYSKVGADFEIIIHNQKRKAQVAEVPFYRRNK